MDKICIVLDPNAHFFWKLFEYSIESLFNGISGYFLQQHVSFAIYDFKISRYHYL